MIHLKFQGTVL